MDRIIKKWTCSNCGSDNVEQKVWYHLNGNVVIGPCEGEAGPAFCHDCNEATKVELREFLIAKKDS